MIDKKTIKELETALKEKHAELSKKLQEIATLGDDGKWEPKYVDRARETDVNANEVEDYANEIGVVSVLSRDYTNIEIALKKIADNSYGKCEVCGADIPLERLKVLPEARTCAQCTLP